MDIQKKREYIELQELRLNIFWIYLRSLSYKLIIGIFIITFIISFLPNLFLKYTIFKIMIAGILFILGSVLIISGIKKPLRHPIKSRKKIIISKGAYYKNQKRGYLFLFLIILIVISSTFFGQGNLPWPLFFMIIVLLAGIIFIVRKSALNILFIFIGIIIGLIISPCSICHDATRKLISYNLVLHLVSILVILILLFKVINELLK